MTATTLAPITRTTFHERLTRGGAASRRECWRAVTDDGAWEFERQDEPGTPWAVIHRETGTQVGLCGTLRACRQYVGSGRAAGDLKRITEAANG